MVSLLRLNRLCSMCSAGSATAELHKDAKCSQPVSLGLLILPETGEMVHREEQAGGGEGYEDPQAASFLLQCPSQRS